MFGGSSIERIRAVMEREVPFQLHLQMRLTQVEKGMARLEMPYTADLIGAVTPPSIHGGAIAALIDSCGGAAVFTLFEDAGDSTRTANLRVDYLRRAPAGTLVAEARVVRSGKTSAVVDIVVHGSEDDRPVAIGRGAYDVRYNSSQ